MYQLDPFAGPVALVRTVQPQNLPVSPFFESVKVKLDIVGNVVKIVVGTFESLVYRSKVLRSSAILDRRSPLARTPMSSSWERICESFQYTCGHQTGLQLTPH